MIKRRNIDTSSLVENVGEWLVYDLAAGNANAFALAEQNPYDYDVIITRVIVNLTTAGGTGSSVGDMDIAADATSTGDDIFDGIDLNSTGLFDSLNATDNGSNGEGKCWTWDARGGTNDYVTLKILVQNAASLAGKVFINIVKA
jgi:hypothetical protein